MFAGGPNPTQIQFVPPGKAGDAPLPLVLVHDGGGTTFSYLLLSTLARDVWAIHNPKFFDGLPWDGGLDEMAKHYLDLIAAELSGPIMLGGWSLGGFLSLTMARLIAADPESYPFSVAGLVLIDSPYHIARSKVTVPTSKPEIVGLPPLVQKSFDNCEIMLRNWDLPSWGTGDKGGGTDVKFSMAGDSFTLPKGQVLRKPVGSSPHDNKWETMTVRTYEGHTSSDTSSGGGAVGSPPPAVLLRCVKHAKSKPSAEHGQETPSCLVDLFRDEKLLGWEARYPDFIKAVIEVDADHYNLFSMADTVGLERVSAQVLKALEVVDALQKARRQAK